MPRDRNLEALISDDLGELPGLTQKVVFGGLAWLINGRLLCGASSRGIMVRLGKGNDAWALAIDGNSTVVMKGRQTPGWVRATAGAYVSDELRHQLLDAAVRYVRSLPAD